MNTSQILPETAPARGEPLEVAYRRVSNACRDAGLSVYTPEVFSDERLREDFAPYFHVAGPDSDPETYCMVFVIVEPWGQDQLIAFLNTYLNLLLDAQLRREVGRPVFIFRSAYPMPSMLSYIFADWAPGRLEAAALARLSDEALTARSAPSLAVAARALMAEHLGQSLSLDELETVGRLESLLLGALRGDEDPALALSVEAYQPRGVLSLLGAMLGEVIRRAWPTQVRWVETPPEVGAYPSLLVGTGEEGPCTLFPIDRVHRCFQEGSDRDLKTWLDVVVAHALSGRCAREIEDEWGLEAVVGQLMPVLKPVDWLEHPGIEARPLLELGLRGMPRAVVAIDHPQRVAYLLAEQRQAWEMAFDEVMGLACANLARASRQMADHFEELDIEAERPIYRVDFQDYFNASRLMLGQELHQAAREVVAGQEVFLVAAPSRDNLLVTPCASAEHQAHFQDLVRWFHQRQPAPLSSLCFILDARGLVGFAGFES